MTWSLAHQGGWDEFLMFAVPIVLAIVIVRRLEKRRPPSGDGPQDESQNTTP
ncbi:MAG: hypothetical protein QNJ77_03330 [Acidimicrobiia bacterium]|nr:hypothetical protein [Acidimicrobiia bacterium]